MMIKKCMKNFTNGLGIIIEWLLRCLLIIISLFTLGAIIFDLYIGIVILIDIYIWLLKNLVTILAALLAFCVVILKYICENNLEGFFIDSPMDNQTYISDWSYVNDQDFQTDITNLMFYLEPHRDLDLVVSNEGASSSQSGLPPRLPPISSLISIEGLSGSQIGLPLEAQWLQDIHKMSFIDVEVWNAMRLNMDMSREINAIEKFLKDKNIALEVYKDIMEINWANFNEHVVMASYNGKFYLIIPTEPLSETDIKSLDSLIKNHFVTRNSCNQMLNDWRNDNRIGPKHNLVEYQREVRLLHMNKIKFNFLIRNDDDRS